MAKHTQTIHRQIANKLFQCVWPFCEIGAQRIKRRILNFLLSFSAIIWINRLKIICCKYATFSSRYRKLINFYMFLTSWSFVYFAMAYWKYGPICHIFAKIIRGQFFNKCQILVLLSKGQVCGNSGVKVTKIITY